MRVILCWLGLVASVASVASGGGVDWMEKLEDKQLISRVTLPGSHDSGALIEPFPRTAKTQNSSIREQLDFGVRLLDIRCRHIGDSFQIHHGMVDQKQTFGEVLASVIGFLKEHPSEFVVMSVNQEFTPKDNSRSFQETFDQFVQKDADRWFLKTEVPKVGEVRGKIVLLRRFARKSPLGLDAGRWPNNRTFRENGLRVQDEYQVKDVGRKWKATRAAFEAARKEKDPEIIHLNFTSGVTSRAFGAPDITTVSNTINPQVGTFLELEESGFFGWLMMDFIDARMAALIYGKNDRDG